MEAGHLMTATVRPSRAVVEARYGSWSSPLEISTLTDGVRFFTQTRAAGVSPADPVEPLEVRFLEEWHAT